LLLTTEAVSPKTSLFPYNISTLFKCQTAEIRINIFRPEVFFAAQLFEQRGIVIQKLFTCVNRLFKVFFNSLLTTFFAF